MSHPLSEGFLCENFLQLSQSFLPPLLLCLWILDERSKVSVATGTY